MEILESLIYEINKLQKLDEKKAKEVSSNFKAIMGKKFRLLSMNDIKSWARALSSVDEFKLVKEKKVLLMLKNTENHFGDHNEFVEAFSSITAIHNGIEYYYWRQWKDICIYEEPHSWNNWYNWSCQAIRSLSKANILCISKSSIKLCLDKKYNEVIDLKKQ